MYHINSPKIMKSKDNKEDSNKYSSIAQNTFISTTPSYIFVQLISLLCNQSQR